MTYSSNRVACQLGFDQGMPQILTITKDFNGCCKVLHPENCKDIHPYVTQIFFPSRFHKGGVSIVWLTYWSLCLDWFDKCKSSIISDNLSEPKIHIHEFYFQPLERRPPNDNKSYHASSPPPAVRYVKCSWIHAVWKIISSFSSILSCYITNVIFFLFLSFRMK